MACESYLTTFGEFCILLTIEVAPKIFPNLNVVAHLVVPVGWGYWLQRLAIFFFFFFFFCLSIYFQDLKFCQKQNLKFCRQNFKSPQTNET